MTVRQATHPARAKRRMQSLRSLHRYGGVTAALLVVVICFTGILLNHTDTLNLSDTRVRSTWLLNWYGIRQPALESYATDNVFVTRAGQRLYLNTAQLDGHYSELCGAVKIGELVYVSTDNKLLLLQADGMLVETLETVHGLPRNIRRIGTHDKQLVVEAETGLLQTDSSVIHWTPLQTDATRIAWSGAGRLPANIREAVLEEQRGDGLPLERVILDIHSGRIIGMAGPWLSDAVAVLFILLALSGVWMWFKTRHSR
jgi:hypothetical protein